MSVAVLTIGTTLVASLPEGMTDRELQELQQRLLERLSAARYRGLVLDLSAMPVVDSYMGRMISETAAMCRLMGAKTVVVGLRPAVAITLVELGLDLPGVAADLDLEKGLAWLRES